VLCGAGAAGLSRVATVWTPPPKSVASRQPSTADVRFDGQAANSAADVVPDPADSVTEASGEELADLLPEFVPLAYGDPLPVDSGLQVVRVNVPRASLYDFGIEPADPRPDIVTADVLVGDDGLPRAVRLVSGVSAARIPFAATSRSSRP
jgi:hypothetical protein